MKYIKARIIVYKDGSVITSQDEATWEFEADPDYLTTINPNNLIDNKGDKIDLLA